VHPSHGEWLLQARPGEPPGHGTERSTRHGTVNKRARATSTGRGTPRTHHPRCGDGALSDAGRGRLAIGFSWRSRPLGQCRGHPESRWTRFSSVSGTPPARVPGTLPVECRQHRPLMGNDRADDHRVNVGFVPQNRGPRQYRRLQIRRLTQMTSSRQPRYAPMPTGTGHPERPGARARQWP